MIGEVSNFPMHMRCILRSIGMRYTQVYDVLELTYFGKAPHLNSPVRNRERTSGTNHVLRKLLDS